MKKSPCAYPLCINYKKGAKKYCCNGCSFNHKTAKELSIDELAKERGEEPSIKDFLAQNTIDSVVKFRERSQRIPIRFLKVNNNNTYYRVLIAGIIDYMKVCMSQKYKDYAEVKGISGINVGIPLAIIVIRNSNKSITMINADFVQVNHAVKTVKSNCGSLVLDEPIEVQRFKKIKVSYYDLFGHYHVEYYEGPIAATIQHEIDHTDGILITSQHKTKNK